MADAALGEVHVVVEVDVAWPHLLDREVARHRIDQSGIRPAGELAQLGVVNTGSEVVLIANHRRPSCAPDGVLDLCLNRCKRALDDLYDDRIELFHLFTTQIAKLIHSHPEARRHRQRRAELLDHGRAGDLVARAERLAVV